MSATKHTSGPWIVGAFGSIGPNGLVEPVAFVQRHGKDGLPYRSASEEAANARLIAAAPTLLAALEMAPHTSMCSEDSELTSTAKEERGLCERCAAVAAAKGETA